MKFKKDFEKKIIKISNNNVNQRIDNFLFNILGGVCKNYIYRILRLGKIKVNQKRVKHFYKLLKNDIIIIPYIKNVKKKKNIFLSFKINIIYEDKYFLAINKENGIAVHSGTGIKCGIIENIRNIRNIKKNNFLELIHRLDRNTSGILLIAKNRFFLRNLHEQIREKKIKKYYLVLVHGIWNINNKHIKFSLAEKKINKEKIIFVKNSGKNSYTIFNLIYQYKRYSLLKAELRTGRMHQIRVHLSYIGYPIVGDKKYGNVILDKLFIKKFNNFFLNKMFLHSYKIIFFHPYFKKQIILISSLSKFFLKFLKKNIL